MTTRKQYSKEFKLDAISLVQEQGYSKSEAARSLGINANVLGRCIKEHETADGQAFRGNGKLTPEQAEIRQLREDNHRLEMEKGILKKPPEPEAAGGFYGRITYSGFLATRVKMS